MDCLAKNTLQSYRGASSLNMKEMIIFLESDHRNTYTYWRKLKFNTYLKISFKIVCLYSLISPAQRPKNRDFRINTIFHMIFLIDWDDFNTIWSRGKFTHSLNHPKTKYWSYIVCVDLIYQSNVKPNMKKFLNIERSMKESDQYDRIASKHWF